MHIGAGSMCLLPRFLLRIPIHGRGREPQGRHVRCLRRRGSRPVRRHPGQDHSRRVERPRQLGLLEPADDQHPVGPGSRRLHQNARILAVLHRQARGGGGQIGQRRPPQRSQRGIAHRRRNRREIRHRLLRPRRRLDRPLRQGGTGRNAEHLPQRRRPGS